MKLAWSIMQGLKDAIRFVKHDINFAGLRTLQQNSIKEGFRSDISKLKLSVTWRTHIFERSIAFEVRLIPRVWIFISVFFFIEAPLTPDLTEKSNLFSAYRHSAVARTLTTCGSHLQAAVTALVQLGGERSCTVARALSAYVALPRLPFTLLNTFALSGPALRENFLLNCFPRWQQQRGFFIRRSFSALLHTRFLFQCAFGVFLYAFSTFLTMGK